MRFTAGRLGRSMLRPYKGAGAEIQRALVGHPDRVPAKPGTGADMLRNAPPIRDAPPKAS